MQSGTALTANSRPTDRGQSWGSGIEFATIAFAPDRNPSEQPFGRLNSNDPFDDSAQRRGADDRGPSLRVALPVVAATLLALVYALVRPATWEATQALVVRDETGDRVARPGRFGTSTK